MSKKKLAILSLAGYLLTMVMGVLIGNIMSKMLGENVLGTMLINDSNIIYKIIIQIPPTVFLLYFIKKYYNWTEVGFDIVDKKGLLWFLPYLIILIFMLWKFINEFGKNMSNYDNKVYFLIVITFIGTVMAGFCEEVIFRGITLNSFKTEYSFIGAMIISSIGFSIVHITTVFMGNSLLVALVTVFYSSLLGFAFVGLMIKIKNIWPLIIFHALWNFILIISQTLKLEVSLAVGICNILNIFMAIILWTVVIIEQKRRAIKKLY
ncbi:CPBP family intramembrane glutamic endopeptidase [Terrisporobacter sp.]